MRFLIDEMFGYRVAEQLSAAGHESVHVSAVGLASANDDDIVSRAAEDGRIVVTENIADFATTLARREAAGEENPPVVIAMKGKLPAQRGAMEHTLVEGLCRWAEQNPEPYRHVHWLG